MKFLFLILAMFLSFTANAENCLVGRSTTLDGVGTVQAGSLEKCTINVKNGSGGALVDGDVVVLDVTADDGYTVTTSSTAGDVPHCVLDEACASLAMCACQTYGYKSNLNFTPDQNNAVAGKFAFISESQAGKADAITSPGVADIPIGVFYDAASATGDVEVFIKLR